MLHKLLLVMLSIVKHDVFSHVLAFAKRKLAL